MANQINWTGIGWPNSFYPSKMISSFYNATPELHDGKWFMLQRNVNDLNSIEILP